MRSLWKDGKDFWLVLNVHSIMDRLVSLWKMIYEFFIIEIRLSIKRGGLERAASLLKLTYFFGSFA